jgi:EmrB/QacA subfamily drug resistance transporter
MSTAGNLRQASGQPTAPQDRTRWVVLGVVLAGFFMILLDGTIMNVAIPVLQEDLGSDYAAAQWMMSGYALAFGLTLIPAGRLGERFGHRGVFIAGLAAFTLASLLCATAGDGAQIVGWRVLQGVAAGAMNPAVLALLQTTFAPTERGRAMVFYGATAGTAAALGPVLGGLIIAADLGGWSWRPIFLLNVPIGVVLLVLALRVLPGSRGRGGSLDPVGIALLSATLLLLTYPLIQGYEQGWPAWVPVSLGASACALAAFVGWQRRRLRTGAVPLIDIRLFGYRSYAAGVAVTVFQLGAFASLQFALSAYLQLGLGQPVLDAGLALLPFAVGTVVGSALSNRIYRRLGRSALHLGGALLAAGTAGLVLTIRLIGPAVDAFLLAPATFVAGIGAMVLGAPLIAVALTDVPTESAGTAGGVLACAQRVGHALGVAVVGTTLFGALPAGSQFAPSGSLPSEYTAAVQLAGLACLGACVAAFLLVFLLPRRQSASG